MDEIAVSLDLITFVTFLNYSCEQLIASFCAVATSSGPFH